MIGLMALVIVALLADRFLTFQLEQPFDQSPASAGAGAVAPVTAGPAGEAEQGRAKSIAVLPFVNMSNDPDQEYFSDGISEELLNALAKSVNCG